MADPDVAHADVAGWVLGVLDPDESERFEAHLETCDECQQEVAELGPTAQMFKAVLPDVDLATGPEPPADLQARTMARIEQASRKSRWRRRNAGIFASAAAAVVVAAAAGIGFVLAQPPALASYTTSLSHKPGTTGSGQAVASQVPGGWSIQMNVEHLKRLGSNQFYECVYAGPDNRPGHPQLIPGGTFTVDASGSASVHMWSAANPYQFPTMEIVIEQAGSLAQQGKVVLVGTTST
jgi:Putative zinc-finger